MVGNSRIILNRLYYSTNDKTIIPELNLSFSMGKYGIAGRNGIGKSTLLKLMIGELEPSSGAVQIEGKIAYFSSDKLSFPGTTVAEALDVTEKLQALQRIALGSIDERDFTLVGDDWCLEEKIGHQLSAFNLSDITLDRLLNSLSGGEQARLLLAKAFLTEADFIILDEPTNNLDGRSRQALYQTISAWQGGLIIVSHDRELLNFMDYIVELSSLGVQIYGGNYDDYRQQKQIEQTAAQQALQTAELIRQQAKELTQGRRERHEKAKAKGRFARKTEIAKVGSLKSRMAFNSAQGRSEKTQRKIILQAERKLAEVNANIQTARARIESNCEISIELPHTQVPNGKMILEIKNLSFSYPQQPRSLIENFSLEMQGPQRLAILGDNGSGKTTLIKLILGELSPSQGSIILGTQRISYVDQKVKIINPELSVLDNFLHLNPDIRELDARYHLADFLFRNDAAQKLACHLSGGERLRAALACILMSLHPPQLLILDEPTNHLDLQAIASIESALQKYRGALIVISHDTVFLNNLDIQNRQYL